MIEAVAEVWGNGDGYLTVDSGAWKRDRGDLNEALTESLSKFLDGRLSDYQYPTNEDFVAWVKWYSRIQARKEGFGPGDKEYDYDTLPGGLYGEGEYWDLGWTGNNENFLSSDFGMLVLGNKYVGSLMIETAGSGSFLFRRPDVWVTNADDETAWVEYSRAYARCVNGHEWYTDDNYRLYSDGMGWSDEVTISDQGRSAFGGERQYIACPDCAKKLHFLAA